MSNKLEWSDHYDYDKLPRKQVWTSASLTVGAFTINIRLYQDRYWVDNISNEKEEPRFKTLEEAKICAIKLLKKELHRACKLLREPRYPNGRYNE